MFYPPHHALKRLKLNNRWLLTLLKRGKAALY